MARSMGQALIDLIASTGARPSRSTYTAQSWSAQVHHMQRTQEGRERLAAIATPRTVKAWASGDRGPSKRNLGRIDDNYRQMAGGFPQELKDAELKYTGPSPWSSDGRTPGYDGAKPLVLGAGAGLNWEAIEEAWEAGELDEDTAEDLAREDLFEHDLGSISPIWGGVQGDYAFSF